MSTSMDPYDYCLCGSGKKVKFCCSRDLAAELGRILRALAGDQRVAAREQLERTIRSVGERPSLLCLKWRLAVEHDGSEAEETARTFVARWPDHPSAGFFRAMLLSGEPDRLAEAVDALQDTLEAVGDEPSEVAHEGLAVLGIALLRRHRPTAGLAHLLAYFAAEGEQHNRGIAETISRALRERTIAVQLRDAATLPLPPAPFGERDEFLEVLRLAERGRFRQALRQCRPLVDAHPRLPWVWRCQAIFQLVLLETDEAVRSLRRLAELQEVAFEERVDAESLAQLVEPLPPIAQVRLLYAVRDTDRLMERLLSDRTVVQAGRDASQLVPPGEPPPRAAMLLLSGPNLPHDAEPAEDAQLPEVYGLLMVYGKQTDRPARLEFRCEKTDDFWSKTTALAAVAGEQLGPLEAEQPLAEIDARRWLLQPRIFLRVPRPSHGPLIERWFERQYLERWPQAVDAILGAAPHKLAGDPAQQVRLAAAVQRLAQCHPWWMSRFDFGRLHERLGLPALQPRDPEPMDEPVETPTHRIGQVRLEDASEQQLVRYLQTGVGRAFGPAIEHAAGAILRRESVEPRLKAGALAWLGRSSPDVLQRRDHLLQAAHALAATDESPAQLLIEALDASLELPDAEAIQQLLQRLSSRHLREPGVAEYLQRLMSFLQAPKDEAGVPAERSSAPATDERAGIWTPEASAVEAGGQPSEAKRLWLPGQD